MVKATQEGADAVAQVSRQQSSPLIIRSEAPFIWGTFRDYNELGDASLHCLRDSPIHRETGLEGVRGGSFPPGPQGRSLLELTLVVMASSRGNSSSNSVYECCCG